MMEAITFLLGLPTAFLVGFGVPLGILLLLLLREVLRSVGRIGVPRIPTGWMTELWRVFSNAKEDLAIIATLAFLALVLHRVGYANWDLLYYLPGIFVLSLVTKWVMKGRRFVPLTMAIVAFTILSFSHPWPADPTKSTWTVTKEWWNRSPPPKVETILSTPRVAVTPQCPGVARPLTVGVSPQEFNPGAICFVYLRVDTGRIRFSGPNGSKVVGPEGGDFHGFPVSTAQAVDGSASMRYILCPGQKRSSGDWTCS